MDRNDMVGYLLLNERKKKNNRAYWECTCTLCGNDKDIREDTLQSGKTVSCGCYQKTEMHAEKIKQSHPIEDLTGNVYHELTVLRMSDKRVGKKIMCTCLCSCGKIVDVFRLDINGKRTDGLNRVRMEEHLMRLADGADFPDGLDGAYLIVGIHDRDKAGFRTDSGFHFFRQNDTVLMHIQQGDLKAFGFQLLQGVEHRVVFKGGGDDVVLSVFLSGALQRVLFKY